MASAKDINERELLEYIRVRAGNLDMPNPVDSWVAKGFPQKVVYAKLENLDKRGLIEFGVSIRQCWLTSRGKAYISKEPRKS